MKLLTVIISTLNEGITNTLGAVHIQHPMVQYLIIHQNNTGFAIPSLLERADITIITTQSVGLSKSRNIGLQYCQTAYALIADDDLIYVEGGFDLILQHLNRTGADLLTFKIKTSPNEPEYKFYASHEMSLQDPGIHYISSVEICAHIPTLKEHNITFDERFGLGTTLKKGEEEILIDDCLKSGLKCIFIPAYIVRHPFESSGKSIPSRWAISFFEGAFNERLKRFRILERNMFKNFSNFRYKFVEYLGMFYIRFFS